MDSKGGAAAEIQITGGAPLSELRSSAWLYAQVSNLPYLLPRVGLAGQDPRRGEIELVRQVFE
jgi:hypothetical protein